MNNLSHLKNILHKKLSMLFFKKKQRFEFSLVIIVQIWKPHLPKMQKWYKLSFSVFKIEGGSDSNE